MSSSGTTLLRPGTPPGSASKGTFTLGGSSGSTAYMGNHSDDKRWRNQLGSGQKAQGGGTSTITNANNSGGKSINGNLGSAQKVVGGTTFGGGSGRKGSVSGGSGQKFGSASRGTGLQGRQGSGQKRKKNLKVSFAFAKVKSFNPNDDERDYTEEHYDIEPLESDSGGKSRGVFFSSISS